MIFVTLAPLFVLLDICLSLVFFRNPIVIAGLFLATRALTQPAAYFGTTFVGMPIFIWPVLIILPVAGIAWVNSPQKKAINVTALWYCLFVLLTVFSFIGNIGSTQSTDVFIKLIGPLVLYVIVFFGVNTMDDIKRMLLYVVLSSVVPIFFGLYQYAQGGGYSLAAQEYVEGNRITGTIVDPNLYGIYLSLILFCCMGLIFLTSKRSKLLLGFTAVVLWSLVLAQNRGTWLAVAVAVPVALLIFRSRLNLRRWIAGAIALAVIASPTVITRFAELGEYNRYGISKDTFSERLIHHQHLLQLSLDSPIIGTGFGSATIPLPFDLSRPVMPHNDYVRSAVEFGYPSVFVYLIFLFSQLFFCAQMTKRANWGLYFAATAAQVYIIIISISQNVFGDILNYSTYMALLALTHRAVHFSKQAERVPVRQSALRKAALRRAALRRGASSLSVVTILGAVAAYLAASGSAKATEVTQLPRSAAVGMVSMPPALYKAVGVDFIAWGDRPDSVGLTPQAYRVRLQNMRQIGTEVGATIPTRTGSRGFIRSHSDAEVGEAMCRTCDGSPVVVPGFQGQEERGQPIAWISTSSEQFRAQLSRTFSTILDSGARSLMIDDVAGALAAHVWFGGCYSKADLAGLNATMRARTGRSIGADLCSFHKKATTPGTDEFRSAMEYYQTQMAENISNFERQAEARGLKLAYSGNQQIYSAFSGPLLKKLDFFSFECPQTYGPDDEISNVLSAKMGEALGKPTILIGTGGNHRYIAEKGASTLLRSWIAEAYANGAYFVVPYGLWMDRAVAGGVTWLRPPLQDFTPLFHFIKTQRALFDNKTERARVAVVLDQRVLAQESPTDQNRQATQVYRTSLALLRRGIPFKIVPVVDDSDLEQFVKSAPGAFDWVVTQRETLQRVKAGLPSLKVTADANDVPGTLALTSDVRGGRYRVSLRDNAGRHPVLHITNQNFDVAHNAMVPIQALTISIPKAYFKETPRTARVYSINDKGEEDPSAPSVVPVRDAGDHIRIVVGNVALWSVVEF
jgi:hypothetical protein